MSALPHCGKLPQFASTHPAASRNLLVCIVLSVNVPFLRSRGKLGQYIAHPIESLAIDPEDLRRFGDVSLGMGQHAGHVTVLQIVQ